MECCSAKEEEERISAIYSHFFRFSSHLDTIGTKHFDCSPGGEGQLVSQGSSLGSNPLAGPPPSKARSFGSLDSVNLTDCVVHKKTFPWEPVCFCLVAKKWMSVICFSLMFS